MPCATGIASWKFCPTYCMSMAASSVSCALVRPTGIEGMKPKSVKKKLKTPAFAAAVNRDDIQRGIEELGVDQDEHIALVIEALAERSDELGLQSREDAAPAG